MRFLKISLLMIALIFLVQNSILAEMLGTGEVQLAQPDPVGHISLKILTLNIHSGINWQGNFDLDSLVSFIQGVNPDIMGFQEVPRYWGGSGKDLPGELQSRLNMFAAYSVSREWNHGYFGNLILSKYPIVQIWTEKMPGSLEPRSYGFIQILKEGVRINFLTTHLGLSDADRLAQINEIIKLINLADGPIVVSGDFNGGPSDISVQPFKENFIDLQQLSGNSEKGTFRLKDGNMGPRMDYIFVSPDFNLNSFQIFDNFISDHLPILAEVNLKVSPVNVTGAQNYIQN